MVNLCRDTLEAVPVNQRSISSIPGFIKLDRGQLYGVTHGDEFQVFIYNIMNKSWSASEIQRNYYPIGFDAHSGIVAALCFSRPTKDERETTLLVFNCELELIITEPISLGNEAFNIGSLQIFGELQDPSFDQAYTIVVMSNYKEKQHVFDLTSSRCSVNASGSQWRLKHAQLQ